jgi:hypothetical protein
MDSPITFLFLRKSLNLVRVEPSPDEKNIEIAVLRLKGPEAALARLARSGSRE